MASHCESSPGSFDECRLSAEVDANSQTKPTDLECRSLPEKAATVRIHHRHLLGLLLSPRADTHFTAPRRVEGWVDLGTAVTVCSRALGLYRSGCREKHNCPLWDSNLGPLTPQSGMLLLDHWDLRNNVDWHTDVDTVQRIADMRRFPHVDKFVVDAETTNAAAESSVNTSHVTDEWWIAVAAKKHLCSSPTSILRSTFTNTFLLIKRVDFPSKKPGPNRQQCRWSNNVEATGYFVACCFDRYCCWCGRGLMQQRFVGLCAVRPRVSVKSSENYWLNSISNSKITFRRPDLTWTMTYEL